MDQATRTARTRRMPALAWLLIGLLLGGLVRVRLGRVESSMGSSLGMGESVLPAS